MVEILVIEKTVFQVPADEHGKPVHYPGEEDNHQHHHQHHQVERTRDITETPPSSNTHDDQPPLRKWQYLLLTGLEYFKYLYSMALLIFSIVLVLGAMFTWQSTATHEMGIHPALAFFIFWFLILWLAMMEGGQGCLVGLQWIDKSLYQESHPRTLKSTTVAHKGDNMERFIVGRQFLVVLVVFISNLMASAIPGATLFNLPEGLTKVFLESGVALILVTIELGQLTAQVNAAKCMLDFINNYFMVFTTYVSLFIEATGLLHAVYLVQIIFAKVAGKPVESDEPPRTTAQKVLFWGRVALSMVVLGFSFAVTLAALFQGKTTMWPSVPDAVSVILFFMLMCFVGLMEGMQIALFAVVNLPRDELMQHPLAHKTCELTFRGHHLQAFLIGRQICVTVCTFVVARITTLAVTTGQGENIFGVSDGLQNFFNTGLLGAIITTIVASLAWRVVASSFPVAFLSNPLIYAIVRLCLLLEMTGVCSVAWLLALLQKRLAGYQVDEVYVGTPEERALIVKVRQNNDLQLQEQMEEGVEVEAVDIEEVSTEEDQAEL